MLKSLYRAVAMTVLLLILLCGIYPAVVTVIGQTVFPGKANGGIVSSGGQAVGALLIGQGFTRPEYFHPRPSAAGDKGYDASSSSGSNLGPTNKKLIERMAADVAKVRAENPEQGTQPVPVDLVTTSASGLDPHISPEAAVYQAARVAKARNLPVAEVLKMIDERTEKPLLGFIGAPVVNVLALNLALNAVAKMP